jgi:hypothetical protein
LLNNPRVSITSQSLAADACGEDILRQSFNQYPGNMQNYTLALFQADFPRGEPRLDSGNPPVSRRPGYTFFAHAGRAAVGSGQLQTTHPAGCLGTNECGLQFDVRLPLIYPAVTFSYWFRFSTGFDWTSGGKLPGVCSERACPILQLFLISFLSKSLAWVICTTCFEADSARRKSFFGLLEKRFTQSAVSTFATLSKF